MFPGTAMLALWLWLPHGNGPGGSPDRESIVTLFPARSFVLTDPALEPVRRRVLAGPYVPLPAQFTLHVNGEPVPYRVAAVCTLPGGDVSIGLTGLATHDTELRMSAGEIVEKGETHWVWRAPEQSGIYAVRVTPSGSDRMTQLNVFVLHPFDQVKSGQLNGFRIGSYPRRPLRGNGAYLPPEGFIEVNAETENVLVSPHFALGQFRCKQAGDRAYIALSTPLLRKLEALLDAVNRAGYCTPTLTVMSGFRTPLYNAAIGYDTGYSRLLWGDAADLFVDTNGDGVMDDLNGDGKVSLADAHVLVRLARVLEEAAEEGIMPGGLAAYRATAAHGPFVHLDTRGYAARW